MATKRPFGLTSATAIVIASMIGTGVFTTSGFLLASLGSPLAVLVAWVLGGALAMLGALSYGALARRLPESGGEYLFLSRTVHPAAGYLAGWISLFAGFSAPLAAAAFAFGTYSQPWWPRCPPQMSASILLLAAAALHACHVQRGAWLQNAAVALKLILIALFVGLAGARLRETEVLAPRGTFSLSAFAVSLVWVSYSYAGWNAAVYVGGEIRDPERTLPRALILGTGLVTLVYLLLNAIFLLAAPASELSGQLDVGLIAAAAIDGPVWIGTVSLLISLALVAHVSAMTMSGPRVYARMAQDGYLPRWMSEAEGPPRAAIALQLGLALTLLWTTAYDWLLTYIGFTLGLSTALTVVGLIRLRLREGIAFPVPGWPWLPAVFLLAVATITAFTIWRRPWESLVGIATMGLGLAAYRLTGQKREQP